MKVVREIVVAGKTIFMKIRLNVPSRVPGEKRQKRQNPTSEHVEKYNQKQAEKILAIKINHNFKPGDFHLVLTYAGEEPTKEEAKKRLNDFIKNTRKEFKKKGVILKYITATEYEDKKIHHHIVVNSGISIKMFNQLWPHGLIKVTPLDESGDYRVLAHYIIKETSKTFRTNDAFSKRRYNCSRTIVTPEARVDEVKASNLIEEPEPIKGYYIDQDSVYKGSNPFTERPYMEYVMILLEDGKQRTRWNRGKKRKLKARYYKTGEQQLRMDAI